MNPVAAGGVDLHAAKVWREFEPSPNTALSQAEAFIDDVDARIDDDDGEECYRLLVNLVSLTKGMNEKVRNLVQFYDSQIGTPCERIELAERLTAAQAEADRLRVDAVMEVVDRYVGKTSNISRYIRDDLTAIHAAKTEQERGE